MVLIEKMKSYGISLCRKNLKVFWNTGEEIIAFEEDSQMMFIYFIIPKEQSFKKNQLEHKVILNYIIRDMLEKDISVFISGMFIGKLVVELLGKSLYRELNNHIILGISFPYPYNFINKNHYEKVIKFVSTMHQRLIMEMNK